MCPKPGLRNSVGLYKAGSFIAVYSRDFIHLLVTNLFEVFMATTKANLIADVFFK